jgi:hypothetical protein
MHYETLPFHCYRPWVVTNTWVTHTNIMGRLRMTEAVPPHWRTLSQGTDPNSCKAKWCTFTVTGILTGVRRFFFSLVFFLYENAECWAQKENRKNIITRKLKTKITFLSPRQRLRDIKNPAISPSRRTGKSKIVLKKFLRVTKSYK